MCALQQVIGYTILDVNRTLQQNSLPVTEQQQEALNNKFRESGQNVAGKGRDFTTESTTQSASPCHTDCSCKALAAHTSLNQGCCSADSHLDKLAGARR